MRPSKYAFRRRRGRSCGGEDNDPEHCHSIPTPRRSLINPGVFFPWSPPASYSYRLAQEQRVLPTLICSLHVCLWARKATPTGPSESEVFGNASCRGAGEELSTQSCYCGLQYEALTRPSLDVIGRFCFQEVNKCSREQRAEQAPQNILYS